MITAEKLPWTDITEIYAEAPFTEEDFGRLGATFERLGSQGKLKLLVTVESVSVPGPRAMWEDLKLAKYIGNLERVAVLTDVDWYGSLAEGESALLPGIDVKRFRPSEREAALAWLQAPTS